jgi:hypothetical protein
VRFAVYDPDCEFMFISAGSTWHVVDYDETTGRVIRKRTAQGYSDSSTWARGQAWALYGFANSVFSFVLCRAAFDLLLSVQTYGNSRIPGHG